MDVRKIARIVVNQSTVLAKSKVTHNLKLRRSWKEPKSQKMRAQIGFAWAGHGEKLEMANLLMQ